MLDPRTVSMIKKSSIEERLQIIEIILQSLRNEIKSRDKTQKQKMKPFKVRKFSLGEEVHSERDEIYSERGF